MELYSVEVPLNTEEEDGSRTEANHRLSDGRYQKNPRLLQNETAAAMNSNYFIASSPHLSNQPASQGVSTRNRPKN